MRTHYVLVDFENVQPSAIERLEQEHFRLLIFVGASQAKVPFDLADALQKLGTRGEYVKITGNGANSLDFHIAYYIGKLAAEEPGAAFHVISGDTGFDPLIRHLRGRGLDVRRVKTVSEVLGAEDPGGKSAANPIDTVLSSLLKMKTAKPRSIKALCNTIITVFGRKVSEQEALNLIDTMAEQGFLSIADSAITYAFSGVDGACHASKNGTRLH